MNMVDKNYDASSLRTLAAKLNAGAEINSDEKAQIYEALNDYIEILNPPALPDHLELRRRRKALGLSQQKLADKFGVIRESIARYETAVHKVPVKLNLLLTKLEASSKKG